MGDFFGMTAFTLKEILLLLGFILISIPLHIFIPKLVKRIDDVRRKNKQAQEEKRKQKAEQKLLSQNDLPKIEDKESENQKQIEK